MDFRQPVTLGRSGLRVSRLGIGSSFGVPAAAIEAAYHEYGVNYLYWGTYRHGRMAEAIRHLAPAQRERLVITVQSYDRTGWLMPRLFERGLRQLGIEYADVLLLGLHNRPPPPRVLDAALRIRERGLARHIAMSGHHRPLFPRLAAPGHPYDVLMLRYNAAHPGAEQDVFAHLPPEGGPGIIGYTATCWGTLLRPRWMPAGEQPLRASDCYRFVLSQPRVDLCLTGPADAEQMREALHTLEAGPLSPEEMERVRRIGRHVRACERRNIWGLVSGE